MRTVIVGSFRKHLAEIGRMTRAFETQKIEVLSPITSSAQNPGEDFVILTTDAPDKTPVQLQRDVLDKIRIVEFLYVANVGGYIGYSASAEMTFAFRHGIPVICTATPVQFSEDIPASLHEYLRRHIHDIVPLEEISYERFISVTPGGTRRIEDDNLHSIFSAHTEKLLQSLALLQRY